MLHRFRVSSMIMLKRPRSLTLTNAPMRVGSIRTSLGMKCISEGNEIIVVDDT